MIINHSFRNPCSRKEINGLFVFHDSVSFGKVIGISFSSHCFTEWGETVCGQECRIIHRQVLPLESN